MQFLTLSRRRSERFTDADIAPKIAEEVERARSLYSEGFIRQIWHRGDQGGACFLVEARDQQDVEAKLATLPLVKAGMLEVVAVVPLLPYRGFLS
ncbi:muconolactone Delta-isomerase family protein [Telmatospirillum sp.]|uniref:muconolactone Delta-isomerase family protein n=1 Tax=Telmatospirillum sp. TaxID=2079197 RepID=UPI00284EC719|nr:muconolactone Delta-isomerase family protein [Telmatospirillum sp.]MDR3437898.1 muconolactone Delta-isomerase family protein [Telmatospirillum sp.]